jgi:PBSX family phage terminase large subunit
MFEFSPHSIKQETAIFSDAPITVCGTGIQWGKTTSGALWLMKYFNEFPTDNFIVTAPTYDIMQQATLPAFMQVYQDWGEYKRGLKIFELKTGGNVFFRTETNPDSIVGVTNCRALWGDEAGKYGLYFWENMQARAARLEGKIILTTSPYALNWLYKDLIKPTQEGKRDDVCLISARSIENPYFSKREYEKQKKTMEPRRFRALYDGTFERMEGLVYHCFHEHENIQRGFNFPAGTKFYGGIDWGHADPFVFLIHAVTPSGVIIQVSEFYKTGMIVSEIADMIKSKMQIYPILQIYCDPSQPTMINELAARGIPCVGADNDILVGVDVTFELIKTRRLKFLEGANPYTMDEIEQYHWPEPKDLKTDQDAKVTKPVDQNNHCMDVLRYINMGTYHYNRQLTPKQSDQPTNTAHLPPHKRIERVKRKQNRKKHEDWAS